MKNYLTTFFSLFLLALSFGCAGPGPFNRKYIFLTTETTLLKAGFNPVNINNSQIKAVEGFIPGKITSLQREGTIYYIYPDLNHNLLLIGNQEAYTRYQQLVTTQLTRIGKRKTRLQQDWTESGSWKN